MSEQLCSSAKLRVIIKQNSSFSFFSVFLFFHCPPQIEIMCEFLIIPKTPKDLESYLKSATMKKMSGISGKQENRKRLAGK